MSQRRRRRISGNSKQEQLPLLDATSQPPRPIEPHPSTATPAAQADAVDFASRLFGTESRRCLGAEFDRIIGVLERVKKQDEVWKLRDRFDYRLESCRRRIELARGVVGATVRRSRDGEPADRS